MVAYPIVVDVIPAAAKGAGALLTLSLQQVGTKAGDQTLMMGTVSGCLVWLAVIHFKLRKGYMAHLSESISNRSIGEDSALAFDVSSKQIVEYVPSVQ